ncbi:hypothetical protein SAMN04488122_0947 [Chitinophaga arvensicola]|uniref:Uncharacterized protein n=1 Tax=Chitinophaga arvensicola TaxID=29529 RepID=A0A1I0PSI3_9BACT|nr:hypothetical protein SAMN04488122_0947 [Chitinophaga arvensicola]
MLIVQWQNTRM